MALYSIVADIPSVTAQAGTGIIRVAPGGSDSAGCGSSAAPCRSIQHAVNIATESNVTIQLAAGTYTSSGIAVVNLDGLNKTLTIMGEPGAIIDGQNIQRGIYLDGFTGTAVLNLQGVTIQNGLVSDGGNNVFGGGFYCVNNAIVSMSDVVIQNNTAQGSLGNSNSVAGGGAAFFRCSITLDNVSFDNNQAIGGDASPRGAQALGGGLFATDSSALTATNLTFTNNRATAGSGGTGFGSNTFDRADGLGGGAALQFGTYTIDGITATQNQATAGSGSTYGGFSTGGVLFFEGATATVKNGTFQNNTVTGGTSPTGTGGEGEGAAIMAINKNGNDSNITLERLTIVNNTARGGNGVTAGRANGGAMTFIGSQITASNIIIADTIAETGTGANRFGGGGAIYISRGTTLNLTHATIAQNSILDTMLGSALIAVDSSAMNVSHSIIANHKGTGVADGAVMALGTTDTINLNTVLFFGNTLDIDGDGSGTVTNTNPKSGDPAFVSPGAPNFNYHLKGNSAAIDMATSSTTGLDIDGETRPNGAARDIGADEYSLPLKNSTKLVNPSNIIAANGPNQTVNYTIVLTNPVGESVTGASITNILPAPAAPVTLALATGPTCTSGTCNFAGGAISWNGDIASGNQVTINYSVQIGAPTDFDDTVTINNNATLTYNTGAGVQTLELRALLFVNGKVIYLPIVVK